MKSSRWRRSLIKQYWFIDSKGNVCYGIENYPVFAIHQVKNSYEIYYYDACLIHTSDSMEDAKEYINSKLGGTQYNVS